MKKSVKVLAASVLAMGFAACTDNASDDPVPEDVYGPPVIEEVDPENNEPEDVYGPPPARNESPNTEER